MVNASMNDRIKPLPRSAVSALLQQSRIRGRWKLAAAFTLVEITIVLTLVGFLLLGMTRIEAFATNARNKRLAEDLKGVVTAAFVYRDRYGALPGDDPRAATRWPGALSGDGNGLLHSGAVITSRDAFDAPLVEGPSEAVPESQLFWQHLRMAELISTGTDEKRSASVRRPVIASNLLLGAQSNALGLPVAVCLRGVSSAAAMEIDRLLDDGRPGTGSLRATRSVTVSGSPETGEYSGDNGDSMTVCLCL